MVFRRIRLLGATIACLSLALAGVSGVVRATTPVVLSTTAIVGSYFYGGGGATVYGYATLYQDPATRNMWVVFGRQPGQSYTAYGTGSSCYSGTNIGVAIIKLFSPGNGGQVDLAGETMTYVSGVQGAWADISDTSTHGFEYIEACFFSSTGSAIDIAATWSTIPYDSGIWIQLVAGNSGSSALKAWSFNLLPSNAGIQGTVSDSVTHAAIPGGTQITVSNSARQYTTTTSSSGSYNLASLLPDSYTVTASGPCQYQPSSTSATLPAATTTTVNFGLSQYQLASLTGYVYGGSTNNPLAGATVTDTCGNHQATTSSSGQYTTWVVGDKQITVTASGPCAFQSGSTQVTVPGGTTQIHSFVLSAWPLGTLSGYVTDRSDGLGISGALVTDSCGGASTTTDSNGYYSLSVVSGKAIVVSATATGYKMESITVTVPSGGSSSQNFALLPPGHNYCPPYC